MSYYRPIP
ncbi:hypothetical protein VTL71DRAFT_6449 [Oculimacula yallundae]|uniref:Uncharacterized protein n=1 Tax=Oculimacula yallundae TaxID=86028 RepID=A0ABR4BZM5_9HELO